MMMFVDDDFIMKEKRDRARKSIMMRNKAKKLTKDNSFIEMIFFPPHADSPVYDICEPATKKTKKG